MSALKVINLGLPKSGTTTLGEALKRAGLRVADWRIRAGQSTGDRINRRFVGKLMSDAYFETGLLAAIRAHHPGAKFVLTYRDPVKLSDSMGRWSNMGRTRLPENAVPGLPAGFGATDAQRIRWIEGHYVFCRRVFGNDPDFLEYDMEDSAAPEQVAAFLGIGLPWWGVANANPRKRAEGAQR